MCENVKFDINFDSFRNSFACSKHILHMYQAQEEIKYLFKVEGVKKLGAGIQLPNVSSFFFDMIKS